MTDYTRDTPALGRTYCPGCEPETDPTLEILDVRWCDAHALQHGGADDSLVSATAYLLGSVEAGGAPDPGLGLGVGAIVAGDDGHRALARRDVAARRRAVIGGVVLVERLQSDPGRLGDGHALHHQRDQHPLDFGGALDDLVHVR